MKYIFRFVLIILLASPALQLHAAAVNDQYINVTLPQPLLQDSIKRILPLTFNVATDQVEGVITIEKISDLQLKEKHITGQILLHGDNMTIKTMVANQEIRLQLGSATTDFSCDAALRYAVAEQTLYIRPLPLESDKKKNLGENNIGEALLLLLNGREFPLELKDIQPVITRINSKTITVQNRIVDIQSTPNSLQFKLAPEISTAQ